MPKILKRILVALAILVAIAIAGSVAFFLYLFWLFMPPGAPKTKVSEYPSLIREWSDTGLVDHFPKAIPKKASNVGLSAWPGFLQGSGWFQLRVTLPADEVAAIQAQAAARAVRTCPPQCRGNIEDPEFWRVPPLMVGSKGDDFPPDFAVYAFETDGDWNHSTGKGVAVSKTRNQVVYWADP